MAEVTPPQNLSLQKFKITALPASGPATHPCCNRADTVNTE